MENAEQVEVFGIACPRAHADASGVWYRGEFGSLCIRAVRWLMPESIGRWAVYVEYGEGAIKEVEFKAIHRESIEDAEAYLRLITSRLARPVWELLMECVDAATPAEVVHA